MNARDVGHFPHWANRDDIGRFTPRVTSAPGTTLLQEETSGESEELKPFAGYAKLSEIIPIRDD